jgi:hypothetical protein
MGLVWNGLFWPGFGQLLVNLHERINAAIGASLHALEHTTR